MYTLFPIFSPMTVYHSISMRCNRTLLFIYAVCNSLHLLTLNSQTVPPPPPCPFFGHHRSVLCIYESVFLSHLCAFVYFRFHV